MQPGVGYRFSSSSQGVTLDIGDPWATNDNPAPCPLQIYDVRYDTASAQYLINVSPGHVNNYEVSDGASGTSAKLLSASPPPNIQIFTAGLTSPGATNYIYIKVENSGSPNYEYPSPSIPPKILVSTAAVIPDTDTISYILIGKIDGYKDTATPPNVTYGLYNFKGCGSLWTERFKCGSTPVIYYWSAI
jgi:hypothetical protein